LGDLCRMVRLVVGGWWCGGCGWVGGGKGSRGENMRRGTLIAVQKCARDCPEKDNRLLREVEENYCEQGEKRL